MGVTTKNVAEQATELKDLSDKISQKQTDVNGKLKLVEEARKVNTFENDKNRKYAKANAALKAKLQFIEDKYDYTSNAKNLSIEDFKELMNSNTSVNNSLTGFAEKLLNVQKEIQSLEAMKNMM